MRWTGQSNAYVSVSRGACCPRGTTPSQAEARRGDDSCERDVSTHGGVTTPSFGGIRTCAKDRTRGNDREASA